MKTLKIKMSGTVQGIFFRKFIQDKAKEIGIRGFVRNLDNGDIEIVAEGRDEKVDEMLEVCKTGYPHSHIKKVEFEEIKNQGFDEFKISRL